VVVYVLGPLHGGMVVGLPADQLVRPSGVHRPLMRCHPLMRVGHRAPRALYRFNLS
jgi:hypothetical protein